MKQFPRQCSRSIAFAVGFVLLGIPLAAVPPSSSVRMAQSNVLQASTSVSGLARTEAAAADITGVDTVLELCLQKVFQFAPVASTDCWGWTDPADNIDYAFFGIDIGVVCVDATNLRVVDTVIGPADNCGDVRWRDFKNYKHYLYAVSECSGLREGLMIIDLNFLPDSLHFVTSFNNGVDFTCHNLSIDTVKGFAYLVKANYDGFRVINLANPISPVETPFVFTGDLHDVFAHNDTVWAAEGYDHAFSIWNMANKLSPQQIAGVGVPTNGYVHNIWPTADRKHVATTEETAGKSIKIWNTSDLNNITLEGEDITPSGLAHNTHYVGDTMFISNYQSGIRVVETGVTPGAPQVLASYDTWPSGNNADYDGAWGCYPFSPNGFVYGSNMDGKLYIFQRSTVIIADSIFIDSVNAVPGSTVAVDIVVRNAEPVRRMIIPFSWSGPLNLYLDSFSVVGTRTSYFEVADYVAYDDFTGQAAIRLTVSNSGVLPDMAPGRGMVARLFFSVPASPAGTANAITLQEVSGAQLAFSNNCGLVVIPSGFSGAALICPPNCSSCCATAGDADHSGSVSIADAVYAIGYIFLNGTAPFCLDEADSDGNNSVNIGDVTAMIGFIFLGGSAPVCGSTGN